MISTISSVVHSFLSGELASSSVHFWLLGGSFVAEICVGYGILLESKFETPKERKAAALVMGGIVAGFIATFLLFVFDEAISHRQQGVISDQQSKIIDLESKLRVAMMRATSRRLISGSIEQRTLTSVMSKFSGMPVKIMSYGDDHEDRTFTREIMRALEQARLDTPWRWDRIDAEQIGFTDNGMMVASGNDERSKEAASALIGELRKIDFCVTEPSAQAPDNIRHPPDGSILIFVGYKGAQSNCK